MSIFGIIGIGFIVGLCFFCIVMGILLFLDNDYAFIISLIVSVVLWISSVFVGIGICSENERVFVQEYQVKKQTIEISLQNENLTGYERLQLVNSAVELNGELAKRKATFNLWHFVVYDNTIYDGIEPIDLTGGKQ